MNKQKFFEEVFKVVLSSKFNRSKFGNIKNTLSKKFKLGYCPTDIEIFLSAPKKYVDKIRTRLLTKPTRTISGVSVCALMARPLGCPHGKCIYCPGGPGSVFGNVPMSYTGEEPSTRRSIRNNYDPYLIVMNRIEQYVVSGHVPEKMEIIIQGGTFPAYPKKIQEETVADIYKAMNDFSKMFYNSKGFDFFKFKKFFELPRNIYDENYTKKIQEKMLKLKGSSKTNLQKEQKKNEKSYIRCVGLTIETKPDWGFAKHGNEMLKLGCTRIELGIQTIYDKVLKFTNRGHNFSDSVKSIRELKDLGFKLNFHMMPGLPGVTKEMDRKSLEALFKDSNLRPDMLKLYPCLVMRGTPLFKLFEDGKFKPILLSDAAKLIANFKKKVPFYCRIMRVQRDIPTFATTAGVDKTNLRQYVSDYCKKKKIHCKCIRCREPKLNSISSNVKYFVDKYESSSGVDYFISCEDISRSTIYGFVRLRFPSTSLRIEITLKSGLIRELHVYGTAAAIGVKGKVQHRGIGKKLMKLAEEICLKNDKDKLLVISGIGVREYFRKIGYKLEGPYMVKSLKF